MKKIWLLLLPASAFLASCSNDLDIAADYKETTIVYGLLNQSDTVQYIQVFKGFLDETTNALVIAQNPDSIFYGDSTEVKIERGGQSFALERIDAAQIGLGRDDGIFIDSPNYVYRLPQSLVEDQQHNLTFINQRTGHVVTAQTPVVKDFTITFPPEGFALNFATQTQVNVQWRSAENGKIYQLVIRFYYEEWDVNTPGDVDTFYVDWPIFNSEISGDTEGGENMSYRIDGMEFYSFLGNTLEEHDDIRRKAIEEPLEFRFFVGAEELYNYIRVNGAQTGITSLSVKPEYTNINGGIGIFSSRYNKSRIHIMLADRSLDSLSCGQHTRDMNFVDRVCN